VFDILAMVGFTF